MRVNGYASEPHFADHVAAVLRELPPRQRGDLMVSTAIATRPFGIRTTPPGELEGPCLTAASGDLRAAIARGASRVALMEHGAGQSYGGNGSRFAATHPAYAGGDRRPADMFLHPGPHPAARDRARDPNARVEIVGSPILDTLPSRGAREDGSLPVVAFAFHFDATISPEARTAFPWIRSALAAMALRTADDRGFELLGHGHPRAMTGLSSWYKKRGIPVEREFTEVCRRADVLVADNTSALFAFAATQRPVVVLNPPMYRRAVHHGLRFWEAASVGVNVDHPDTLEAAILYQLAGDPDAADREAALQLVYGYRSGGARRAAEALADWAAA